MTKPAFVWKDLDRSRGALVVPPEPLPALRELYGLKAALVIEAFREEVIDYRDRVSGQRSKRTLQQIAKFAVPIPWEQLDSTLQQLLDKVADDSYARRFDQLSHSRAFSVACDAIEACKGVKVKRAVWDQLTHVRDSAQVWSNLRQLDSDTDCRLMEAAHHLYKTGEHWNLPPEGLAAVAELAIKRKPRAGPTAVSDLAARMLTQLDGLWAASLRETTLKSFRDVQQSSGARAYRGGGQELTREEEMHLRDARWQLFRHALEACSMASGDKNIEKLLSQAS